MKSVPFSCTAPEGLGFSASASITLAIAFACPLAVRVALWPHGVATGPCSSQPKVGLDVIPGDRFPLLFKGSPGFRDVDSVLGQLDQAVEILGVDHRRQPLAAPVEIDGLMAAPSLVDDIGETLSPW